MVFSTLSKIETVEIILGGVKVKIAIFTLSLLILSCGGNTEEKDICELAIMNMSDHKCHLQGDYFDIEWCVASINDSAVIGGGCYNIVYAFYECKAISDYPCEYVDDPGACGWYSQKIDLICPKCWNITNWKRIGIECNP